MPFHDRRSLSRDSGEADRDREMPFYSHGNTIHRAGNGGFAGKTSKMRKMTTFPDCFTAGLNPKSLSNFHWRVISKSKK